jgi:putative tricarboxylic transport membrane protein
MADIPWLEGVIFFFQWDIILLVILGTVIGMTIGAIPGLGPSMTIAMLLPFVLNLSIYQGVALLISMYKGSNIGGSVSAICFGVPGTAGAALDILDGYPLTKQGKSKKALDTMLYSSIISDVGSDFVLLFSLGPLGALALAVGPRELLGFILFSFVIVIMFVKEKPLKGAISLLIGVVLSLTGYDEFHMMGRWTFGITAMSDGITLLPFLVGLFAFSEVLRKMVEALKKITLDLGHVHGFKAGGENLTLKELFQCYREIFTGWSVGTIIGALPGLGAPIAAAVSYALSKRFSPKSKEFGKGAIQGLAAVEAGNSATIGPVFIPLLTLGIPGNAVAALFLSVFMLQGVSVGPRLMIDYPLMIYKVVFIMIVTNFLVLILSKVLIPLYSYLAYLSNNILVPFMGIFVVFGVYAYQNNPLDIIVMVAIGIVGYWLQAYGFPLVPALIGFILTPILEAEYRRSLLIGRGTITYFLNSPLFLILLGLSILMSIMFLSARVKEKED